MAVTLTKVAEVTQDGQRIIYGYATPDSSFAAGGEALTISQLGLTALRSLHVSNVAGYSLSWDGSTTSPKLLAYMGDNDAVADGAFVAADTKDLSTLTVPIIAVGV